MVHQAKMNLQVEILKFVITSCWDYFNNYISPLRESALIYDILAYGNSSWYDKICFIK